MCWGGLFNFVSGLTSSLGVLFARAITHANFVASNMIQAKLHSNIVFFCVVQWTITTLNNVDNGPQVTIFKGVVKKLDQFLAIIVTHTTKATICRISGLVRNVKRSSSIPFVLFLPSINRPLLKLEVLQQLSITYRTSNYRSCNNEKRIASSLLIVLTTTCVSFIHLNQVKTL